MKNDAFFASFTADAHLFFSSSIWDDFNQRGSSDLLKPSWAPQALAHGGSEGAGLCMIGPDRHANEHAKLAL